MNNLAVFTSREFGTVRTVVIEGEPWLVGKDVADILGYTNPQKAIRDHVDEEDKTLNEMFTVNGTMGVLINESGLYSLVLSSKLPDARKFKRWITSEVIPQIRKTGGYHLPKNYKEALLQLVAKEEENEKLLAETERMRPKEIFADAVATSKTSILIGELAKIICQNGYEIGQNRLFKWMRDNHYLIASGSSVNMPQQRYVEQGLFEVKESSIQNPDGSVRVTKTTKVTGKGQVYFVNKFVGNRLQPT